MMDPKTIKANKDNDKKFDMNDQKDENIQESTDQDTSGELEYFTE